MEFHRTERVFIISIRKDIDDGEFEFPEGFPLELRLKDMLDDEVDEKFYLSNKGVDGLLNAFVDGREHKPNLMTNETEYSPTIDTCVGAQTHRSPYIYKSSDKVVVREATKKGYVEAEVGDSVNIGQPNSKTRRGRVGKQVSQTLTTSGGNEMAVVVDE